MVVRLRTASKETECQARLRVEQWDVPNCELVI